MMGADFHREVAIEDLHERSSPEMDRREHRTFERDAVPERRGFERHVRTVEGEVECFAGHSHAELSEPLLPLHAARRRDEQLKSAFYDEPYGQTLPILVVR